MSSQHIIPAIEEWSFEDMYKYLVANSIIDPNDEENNYENWANDVPRMIELIEEYQENNPPEEHRDSAFFIG